TLTAADKAFDADDLDRARFYVGSALALDGCEERVAKMRDRVVAGLAHRDAVFEAARWPADDLVQPEGEERDAYHALARATVLGEPADMMTAAQSFVQRYPDSDHRAAATLAVGVSRDLAGHREDAETALRAIAGKKTGPGRIAAAMLETPRFTRPHPPGVAERRRARDVAQHAVA